jgi:hypothetical protein
VKLLKNYFVNGFPKWKQQVTHHLQKIIRFSPLGGEGALSIGSDSHTLQSGEA